MNNSNIFQSPKEIVDKFCELTNEHQDNVEWFAWPQMFSNTAGPRVGVVAGQAFTKFQIFAFKSLNSDIKLMYCNGIWKHWDGTLGMHWKPDKNDFDRAKKRLPNVEKTKTGDIFINGYPLKINN